MKRAYEWGWNPVGDTLDLIAKADEIASRYAAQGYGLTLRQMYYQFVAQDLLPNSDKSYKKLGNAVSKARLHGMLNWRHLTDRTRNPHLTFTDRPPTIRELVEDIAYGYAVDQREDQDLRIEVWVEKEALGEVVQRAASGLSCASLSCRGYMSASEMWEAAQRFSRFIEGGQRVLVLHLGDHDPSGMDMTRDIRERLETFVYGNWAHEVRGVPPTHLGWEDWSTGSWDRDMVAEDIATENEWDLETEPVLQVQRIALNMDQIEQYGPPPNPAKFTDSRATAYVEEFGYQSWELDALPPDVLNSLIRDHIIENTDVEKFNAKVRHIEETRDRISEATIEFADRLSEEMDL